MERPPTPESKRPIGPLDDTRLHDVACFGDAYSHPFVARQAGRNSRLEIVAGDDKGSVFDRERAVNHANLRCVKTTRKIARNVRDRGGALANDEPRRPPANS